jgi:diaminopimelate decarboxylase
MNHFELSGGELHCEDAPLSAIAEAVGTPVYVYSTATLERHYTVFRDAFRAYPQLGEPLIAYAVKANSNVSVLKTLGDLGAGADTVSEGEIRRVRRRQAARRDRLRPEGRRRRDQRRVRAGDEPDRRGGG